MKVDPLIWRLGQHTPLGEQRLVALDAIDSPYLHFKSGGVTVKKSGQFASVVHEPTSEDGFYSVGGFQPTGADGYSIIVGSTDAVEWVPRARVGDTLNVLGYSLLRPLDLGFGGVTTSTFFLGGVAWTSAGKVRYIDARVRESLTWDGQWLKDWNAYTVVVMEGERAEPLYTGGSLAVAGYSESNARIAYDTGGGSTALLSAVFETYLRMAETDVAPVPVLDLVGIKQALQLELPHLAGQYQYPPTVIPMSAAVWLAISYYAHPSRDSFAPGTTNAEIAAAFPTTPLLSMHLTIDSGATWIPIDGSWAPELVACFTPRMGCPRRAHAEFSVSRLRSSFSGVHTDGALINGSYPCGFIAATYPAEVWTDPNAGLSDIALPPTRPLMRCSLFYLNTGLSTLELVHTFDEWTMPASIGAVGPGSRVEVLALPNRVPARFHDALFIHRIIGGNVEIYRSALFGDSTSDPPIDPAWCVHLGTFPLPGNQVGQIQFVDESTLIANVFDTTVVGGEARSVFALFESTDYGKTWHFRSTVYRPKNADEMPDLSYPLGQFAWTAHLRTNDLPAAQNPQAPWVSDILAPIP